MSYIEIYQNGRYLETNPTWHVEESPFKAKHIVPFLQRNHIHPKLVCEVGCGAGEVLKQLQERMSKDCEFWGYEISPQAYTLSKSRENERLHFKLADLTTEDALHSDLLLVLDVVEHLEDYFTFLRAIRSKAEYKLFHFPLDLSVQAVVRKNGMMKRRVDHAHIHYFTKELALQVLLDTGYDVVDHFFAPRSNEIGPQFIQKLFRIPRSLFFAVNKDLAVRVLGGYSLFVLAR
ncbi:MAG TPA: class I SAM-dependent methyltransferase [Candidatus Acidoferrales bacterium]|nr:class I SAM-dependent methyltransferase [Candidatus Acidoferrales bacterium]